MTKKRATPTAEPSATRSAADIATEIKSLDLLGNPVVPTASAQPALPAVPTNGAGNPDGKPDIREISPNTFLLSPDVAIVTGYRRSHVATRGHLYVAALVILVSLAVAALAILALLEATRRKTETNANARLAEAEIVARRFDDKDRAISDRWFITYQYTAASGQSYRAEAQVSQGLYERLPISSRIYIKYAADNPAESTLTDRELRPVDLELYLFFVFGPAALTLVTLGLAFWRSATTSLYERRGIVIQGQIVEAKGEEITGQYYVRLRYKFKTPGDKELTGQARMWRDDLRGKELPRPGSPVAVLYARDRMYRLL